MEACLRRLALDEACLTLKGHNVQEDLEFSARCSECYQCRLRVVRPEEEEDGIYVVNATFPTEFAVTSTQSGKELCRRNNYAFGAFGAYQVDVDKCLVDVLVQPENPLTPVWVALVVILAAAGVFWVVSRRFRGLTAIYVPLNNDDAPSGRLAALDVFRGYAIAFMIFVNYGGGDYWFFKHSAWNGLTVADLVFPWFLWIMGASIVFSMQSQLRRGVTKKSVFGHIVRRSLILFFLGLVLNSKGRNDFRGLRIPGVLQRFSASYFVVAVTELFLQSREIAIPGGWKMGSTIRYFAILGIITIYAGITYLAPQALGCPRGYTGPGGLDAGGRYSQCTGGIAREIDLAVFGSSHIYQHSTSKRVFETDVPFDPEGILGTLTTIVVVFFGVESGLILKRNLPGGRAGVLGRWFGWALVLGLLGGGICGFGENGGFVPVNKNLWSISFALVASAIAFAVLPVLYLIVDMSGYVKWRLLQAAGMNSIVLYVGHELFRGYFPFAWKPYSKGHAERLVMNLWATFLWLLIALILKRFKVFIAL